MRLANASFPLHRAARRLLKAPGFALGAAATLALGAASVLLAVRLIDVTLLRPLPGVERADELLAVTSTVVSAPAFLELEEAMGPVATMAAYRNQSFVLGLREGREGAVRGEPIGGVVVTGRFFEVMGVRPAAGRLLGPADDRPEAAPALVMSAAAARRWMESGMGGMGGPAAAVGQVVRLNGAAFEVVGVADPRFRGPQLQHAPEVWISLHAWAQVAPTSFGQVDLTDRTWSYLTTILRPHPGVGPASAASALELAESQMEEANPNRRRYKLTLSPASLAAVGVRSAPAARTFALTLLGAAGLVLLLAAVNVAGLLAARVEGRRSELATRRALGASRARLASELLSEVAVLALAGAALALLLVVGGGRLLAGTQLPGGGSLAGLAQGLDGRLLAAGIAVATVAALLCAAAPVAALLRGPARSMGATMRGNEVTGRPRRRLAAALVSTQIALCLLLLVGAGLFSRAAERALAIDTGLDGERVVGAQVDLGLARYDAAAAQRVYAEARAAILALPGVETADWLLVPPLTDDRDTESLTVPGYEFGADEFRETEVNVVGPGALPALGLRLVAGRFHDDGDRPGASAAAVVNEAFVRRYLRGDVASAVGSDFELVRTKPRIVGVVADARWHDLVTEPEPIVYQPLALAGNDALRPMTLVVRTRPGFEPQRLAAPIERALRAAAPGAPVYNVGTFDGLYAVLLAPQRVGAAALGALSLLGLALSATGVFGLVSFAAHRRLREMGIRAALGARPRALVGLLLGQGVRGALAGVGVGLLLAALATPTLRSWLYGVGPFDPLTFVASSGVLLAVTLAAALLPARRAASVDPAQTLRQE